MKLFDRILGLVGLTRRGEVAARYDAAQTTPKNRKHWAEADRFSAPAANTPFVRSILRNRSRYEVANNGFLDGIRTTLANDTVATGPRLQVRTSDKATNDLVEASWLTWAERVGLATKLRTMRNAKMTDGEAFGILTTNRRLAGPMKLDLRLVEADQVAAPDLLADPELQDGIRFDDDGNPVAYFLLRSHPGDLQAVLSISDYDEVPAEFVVHYFSPKRPGERRATPEITSTLSLGADGRRYRNAVVEAAETAANIALVVETEGAADGTGTQADPFDEYPIVRGHMMVLPNGAKLGQAKPEQPTTTHSDFVRAQLTETARPLCMPYNIAAGDSSSYNYASGRLDHQSYFKAILVEQDLLRTTVLERLFEAWLREASLGTDRLGMVLRAALADLGAIAHQWLWPGSEHVDPQKEANAQETRLRTGMTTKTRELARQGVDIEVHEQEQAQEAMSQLERVGELLKRARDLGVPDSVAISLGMPAQSAPASASGEESENTTDEGREERAASAQRRRMNVA